MSTRQCLVCGETLAESKLPGLLACSACSFTTADLTVSDAELERLYGPDYFAGQEYMDYVAERPLITRHFQARLSRLLRYVADPGSKRLFEIGSAYPFEERKTMMIKGRDLISGIPRTLVVDDAEIREALQEPIGTIVNAIKVALENTPPELAGDIIDRGIVLTGGGSLLKGMDTRFREETNLPIITVDDPLTSVVLGVGKILDELDLLAKVAVMSQANTFR